MAVHIISVLFTSYIMYLAVPGSDLFSWHPTCMTVGYILMMLQAIVIFSPESSLTPTSPRPAKVQIHWMLHAFGIFSALCGFAAVYLNKEIHKRKHFTTWHGKFGLATTTGILIAMLGGIAARYSATLKDWLRIKPINMKLYHATLGMLVFLSAMTTVALASYSNWFKNRVDNQWVRRLIMWAPVILAVCVARQVTLSYLPRILEPRESEYDAKQKEIQRKIEEKLERERLRKLRAKNGDSSDKTSGTSGEDEEQHQDTDEQNDVKSKED